MSSGRTHKKYLLRHASVDGQLVVVSCNRCRRTVTFLAADLVQILNPDREAHFPPYPCSGCKQDDMVQVKLRLPAAGDYGDLVVRRPGPVKITQTWRTVKLGD